MNSLIERLKLIVAENPSLEGDSGQTGLRRVSGASKSVVNQWLDGSIKSMNIKYALNIEKNLGYSHLWIMLGPPHEKRAGKKAVATHLAMINEKELELLTTYRWATVEGKDMIEKVAKLAPKSSAIDGIAVVGDKS